VTVLETVPATLPEIATAPGRGILPRQRRLRVVGAWAACLALIAPAAAAPQASPATIVSPAPLPAARRTGRVNQPAVTAHLGASTSNQ
jgi:hypothetical protein